MAKAIEGLYEKYLQLYGKKERWRLGGSFGDALKDGNIDDAMAHADDTNKQRLKLIVNNYYQYGETYKDFLLGKEVLTKEDMKDWSLDKLKRKRQKVIDGLRDLNFPSDSASAFGVGRLSMKELLRISRQGEKLLQDINDLIRNPRLNEKYYSEEDESSGANSESPSLPFTFKTIH